MKALTRLQLALPKPLLFGLYGALGGLVGALAFGEGLWLLLRPPLAPKVAPPPLRLAASPDVEVYQGGKNHFGLKIAREKWDGPVTISAPRPPAGVTITPATVAADRNEFEAEVAVADDAPPGTLDVTIEAQGPAADVPRKAETSFKLTVRKSLPPPPELRLSSSPEVAVEQQGANKFFVTVARDRFRGPVTLAVSNLPGGVTAAPITIPAEENSAEIEVKAAASAPVGQGEVVLNARGPDGLPGVSTPPSAIGRLRLTVNKYEPPVPTADIMFVLDVTGSMQFAINGIRDGIIDFAQELERSNLDVRIGLLAFRDRFEGEEPQIINVGGEVFTKDYARFREQIGDELHADGGGDPPESDLDALALAAKQPFRPHVNRVLILITDAPMKIPDKDVPSVDEAVRLMQEGGISQLHLVIQDFFRPMYTPLQEKAKGLVFDVREAARDRAAFARLMPEMSRAIAKIAIASAKPPAPPAASPAPPPPAPRARAAGELATAAAPPVLRSVQSEASFAAGSTPRLIAAIAVWTSVIAAMIALALCAGQHHYLREAMLPPLDAIRGWGGGLVAGLAGGAAGQALYQVAPPGTVTEVLFQVLGWTLLGSLAGLVLAFFVPNLRSDRGLMGGALGGAVGALGYLSAAKALSGMPAGEPAGRILGAVLLGLCIGLMLALAERMARKAWLQVAYGGGETRSVNLGIEPVSIGSNTKAVTIFARGAAPVAYRYWFLEGKVKCQDMASNTVTELAPNTSQNVGAVVVSVHTASQAAAGPASRSAAGPPPTSRPMPVYRPPTPLSTPPQHPAPGPAPAPPPLQGRPLPQPPRPPAPAPGSASAPPRAPSSDPNACPSCGRPVTGPAGRRYCVVCDLYF